MWSPIRYRHLPFRPRSMFRARAHVYVRSLSPACHTVPDLFSHRPVHLASSYRPFREHPCQCVLPVSEGVKSPSAFPRHLDCPNAGGLPVRLGTEGAAGVTRFANACTRLGIQDCVHCLAVTNNAQSATLKSPTGLPRTADQDCQGPIWLCRVTIVARTESELHRRSSTGNIYAVTETRVPHLPVWRRAQNRSPCMRPWRSPATARGA